MGALLIPTAELLRATAQSAESMASATRAPVPLSARQPTVSWTGSARARRRAARSAPRGAPQSNIVGGELREPYAGYILYGYQPRPPSYPGAARILRACPGAPPRTSPPEGLT